MTLDQIKIKRKNEKEANIMIKELIKRPVQLKQQDFKPGKMLIYSYAPKYDKNPYDMSPLIMVLGRTKKHTLGWSINWTPPKMRQKVLGYIMKKNKRNIEHGRPIEIDYRTIKKIIKGLGPVIRLYLNNRISRKGVSIPSYDYNKTINLRAENFIGISAEEAWKMAVKKYNSKKSKKSKTFNGKKVYKRKGRKG